ELAADRERRIADEVARRRPGLRDFVRRRVADAADAEDILQDVLAELAQALRLPDPIEEVGAWLFRVARNRIVDRFRKKRPEALEDSVRDGEAGGVDELLPSSDAGPEAAYARAVLIEELEAALNELPAS